MAILSGFIIPISSKDFFDAGRICLPIGMLISILYIYIDKIKEIQQFRYIKYSLIVILIIYAIFNIINYIITVNRHVKLNKLEEQMVLNIGEHINKYEKKNSYKIKNINIVFLSPLSSSICYHQDNTTNYNALCREWSLSGVIRYYLNYNYTTNFITFNEYKNILKKNSLNEEKFVFIKNSVFVLI